MIVVMKKDAQQSEVDAVIGELEGQGMQVNVNNGVECVVLGVLGDTTILDKEHYGLRPGVERVMSVLEPYKKANRKFHPEPTIVHVGDIEIGGKEVVVTAGPCSVENREQISFVAREVRAAGARLLRGGAFKPRTSPYAFQGLKQEGLELLKQAREETGLPIVSEIMSPKHVQLFEDSVDVIQVGARNMQNFDLLRELGGVSKPILLKRGLSSTIEEWLMSAEYILAAGNPNVILCERGIRTFENYTRNTLDLSAIVAVRQLSHLPIVVDPSHASGRSSMVPAMAMAAVAAGADGLLIEVHNDPESALSDGPQSLRPEQFAGLMDRLRLIAQAVGRQMASRA